MKIFLLKLRKNQFIRNVLIIATGTAAAQFITLILSPIITRLYGPEAFGMLGVFTAVIGVVAPVAALTYPVAIVLPRSDKEAKYLVKLSIYICISFAIIVSLILLICKQTIIDSFNIGTISSFLFLIPLVIMFSGIFQVTEQWFIRKKQFRVSAKVTLLEAVIMQGSRVGIGIFYPTTAVLIIITVIGQLLKPMMMIFFYKRETPIIERNEVKRDPINFKMIAKKYRDFPLYRAPESFINGISQGLPILMLTSFFGPASAGFYSLGRTVLSAPTQLLGKAVTDVFYPRISEASKNGENIYILIKKSTLALGAVGLVPFGLIMIFSPFLFGVIFGSSWVTAGEYTRWIAIWSYFGLINRPSVAAIPVLSAQLFYMNYSIVSLLLRLAALALGYLSFSSDLLAIAFFSIIGALLNVVLIVYTLKRSKERNRLVNIN